MDCETVSYTSQGSASCNNAPWTKSFGSSWSGSSYTITHTTPHCCACAGACWHTGPATWCQAHQPPAFGVGTGTGGAGTYPSTTACPFCGMYGAHVCGGYTAPNSITFPALPAIPLNCDVCDELLSLEDISASKRICHDCRHAIEVFKTILVEEKKEENK